MCRYINNTNTLKEENHIKFRTVYNNIIKRKIFPYTLCSVHILFVWTRQGQIMTFRKEVKWEWKGWKCEKQNIRIVQFTLSTRNFFVIPLGLGIFPNHPRSHSISHIHITSYSIQHITTAHFPGFSWFSLYPIPMPIPIQIQRLIHTSDAKHPSYAVPYHLIQTESVLYNFSSCFSHTAVWWENENEKL